MDLLTVEAVDAGYNGNPIIKNVSFDADTGDFIGIVGPNACGKTTLLKVLSGIIKPIKGTVKVRGKSIKDLNKNDAANTGIYSGRHCSSWQDTIYCQVFF
jgi:iron complex transport system ATP-binding protein